MAADAKRDPGEYYTSRRTQARRAEHQRWDRRTQIAVVGFAVVVGVAAGMIGTHRTWEHPSPPASPVVHPAVAHRP